MRPKLTYANVVATLALFIALGGASYAALKLPKNSVGTKQIKKNAVNGAKVKDDSLTGNDINEATLARVPSATEAASAQTLGGMSVDQLAATSKLSCPSGTNLVLGVCFETATRGKADLLFALDDCRLDNRRLPTEGELLAFQTQTFTTPPPFEWAEPITYDGSTSRGEIFSAHKTAVSTGTAIATTEQAYRCVTVPSN
jgi:hypothetical protein